MPSKKRIFISFDYDNDDHYKRLLIMWNKNNDFDFEFYDGSLKEAINSTNATYVKSQIRPHIERASHLLCIVGKECARSAWIEWEINVAVLKEKKLVGVKVDKSYISPKVLLDNSATWAMSFTFDAIKKAVDSA